ncbi:MAG: NAD(P)H-quinone oxidoreductase [Alphaproteobacteria bacterium]|nr:NAD(P)H-quinone oxidoreductase [Alphaproteobacteria bacterium]
MTVPSTFQAQDGRPQTMQAIVIRFPGSPEVLSLQTLPIPELRPDEVLIRVMAAGVNRPDLLQRQGLYAPPPDASPLPGLEVAGVVAAVNDPSCRWRIGDEVIALANGGGYAEYCAVPAGQILPKPRNLDWSVAAGIAETSFTVWTNLYQRARLLPHETLLVHGGASGIGTTAIQMATALGSRVLVTARGLERARACEALGAARGIDRNSEDFVELVLSLTDGKGVNVILDMVGGDYTKRNLAALAVEGRLVQIAHLRGAEVTLDLSLIMRNRLTLTGSTLRPRSREDKAQIAAELEAKVWPHLASGKILPQIAQVFKLSEAAAAHRALEDTAVFGKIILAIA